MEFIIIMTADVCKDRGKKGEFLVCVRVCLSFYLLYIFKFCILGIKSKVLHYSNNLFIRNGFLSDL